MRGKSVIDIGAILTILLSIAKIVEHSSHKTTVDPLPDHFKAYRIIAAGTDTCTPPQKFEPGIVCTDSLDFNAAFSPDGQVFYFCRSENKVTRIYARRKNAAPEIVSFSKTNYSDADPAFAPNGDLYFISTRPKNAADTTKDYDIWKVKPLAGGRWSEPVNVEALNSPQNEFYISFTRNGDACFSSNRAGGYGEEDIYTSKYNKGTFGQPQNAGNRINTQYSEYDPLIFHDGKRMIFASSRPGGYGKADLYWSIRQGNAWIGAQHFNKPVNTPGRDYCPYTDAAFANFYYTSDGDVWRMPTKCFPPLLYRFPFP